MGPNTQARETESKPDSQRERTKCTIKCNRCMHTHTHTPVVIVDILHTRVTSNLHNVQLTIIICYLYNDQRDAAVIIIHICTHLYLRYMTFHRSYTSPVLFSIYIYLIVIFVYTHIMYFACKQHVVRMSC